MIDTEAELGRLSRLYLLRYNHYRGGIRANARLYNLSLKEEVNFRAQLILRLKRDGARLNSKRGIILSVYRVGH